MVLKTTQPKKHGTTSFSAIWLSRTLMRSACSLGRVVGSPGISRSCSPGILVGSSKASCFHGWLFPIWMTIHSKDSKVYIDLFSFQIIYLLISNSVSYHGMVIDLIYFYQNFSRSCGQNVLRFLGFSGGGSSGRDCDILAVDFVRIFLRAWNLPWRVVWAKRKKWQTWYTSRTYHIQHDLVREWINEHTITECLW